MAQAGITEIMAVGRVYRKFTDFFTDPMRIPRKFGKTLDKVGGRYVTLGFRKIRTGISDPLANEDEISGRNLRELDKRVWRMVYYHTEE